MFNAHVAANIGPMDGDGKKVSQKVYRNHQVDQAKALLSQITSINTEQLPVILAGDFNSTLKTTPVSAAKTIVDSGMFVDAYSSAETVLADGGTWNGLVEGDKHDKIDHIFVGDEIAPTISSYAVVPTMRKDADGTLHFASDHKRRLGAGRSSMAATIGSRSAGGQPGVRRRRVLGCSRRIRARAGRHQPDRRAGCGCAGLIREEIGEKGRHQR